MWKNCSRLRRLGVLRKASGKIRLHSWKTAKRASYFDSILATRFFCPSTSRIPRNKNGPTDCSVSPLAFLWEGENRLWSHLFVFIWIKNIKNFYTNVHTNKLDLLPEFESISGTPLWYFISHFCPYTSILSHFSGSCKEPYHLTWHLLIVPWVINNKRRKILEAIFAGSVSPAISWADIEGVFKGYGSVIKEGRGSRVWFIWEKQVAVFHRPHP